jgi:hypothetical protein
LMANKIFPNFPSDMFVRTPRQLIFKVRMHAVWILTFFFLQSDDFNFLSLHSLFFAFLSNDFSFLFLNGSNAWLISKLSILTFL